MLLVKQGIDVGEEYGSTEAGLVVMTPFGAWRPGFVGKVLIGAEVKIAEDRELLVRSVGRMVGYLHDEEANRNTFTPDGFCRLGDFAEIDADGFVRLLGRKKEVLNAPDGTNVSAVQLESLILIRQQV